MDGNEVHGHGDDDVRREARVEVSDDDPLVVEGRKATADALDWAAERIAELARGRVLDVGCGEGRFLPAGAVGVDLDEARLRLARSRSPRVVRADAHALPFADATFDTALASRMLNDAGRIDVVLAELRRALRPGGALLVLTLATAAPSSLRRIHDEARDALGLRRQRSDDRLDDSNGTERLAHFFRDVAAENFRRTWRFADASEALDHYASRYVHRGDRDARAAAALFARVRERVIAWRAELTDEERAVLFVATKR